MSARNVNDPIFEKEVEKSEGTVIVDFWADWCMPCKAMARSIDELSNEFEGDIKILKMNVDENPLIPTRLGVRSIPTLLVFKNGNIISKMTGSKSKMELSKWIRSFI